MRLADKCHLKRTICALILMTAFAAIPARADGTLGLDEVLTAVGSAPKLVTEIQAELSKNNLKSENVTCMGARHGNHWTYLGGGRAAPYRCDIGQRSLNIEADRVYFDARGKLLGDVDKADPKRAKTFKEDNFRWTWTP
jgi:hypothetical protein